MLAGVLQTTPAIAFALSMSLAINIGGASPRKTVPANGPDDDVGSHRALFSIEVEFFQLPVLGLDVADRAGDRTHHHGLGLDDAVLAEFDARQQRTGGDAGRREQAVALGHFLGAVDEARIVDAHLVGALASLLGVENQPALHLAADAAHRPRRQHAFGRAAGTDIHIA